MKNIRRHLKLSGQIFAVAILLSGSYVQTARAAITQKGIYDERIMYFNLKPDDCGSDPSADTANPGSPGSGVSGDKVQYNPQVPLGTKTEDQIWYFFTVEAKLSPEAAAGIIGNIQGESGFNPKAEQNPGAWEDMSSLDVNHGGKGGVGLIQWDGGRRPAYINYAQGHNADKKNIVPQLNYIWLELNTSYKDVLDKMKAAGSPEEAAEIWVRLYERPSNPDQAAVNRKKWARTAYNTYFSKTITGTPGSNSTVTPIAGSCDDSGDASASVGTDCGNAQGTERIICAAKLYDPASYAEELKGGHQGAEQWHHDCDLTYHYLGNPPGRTLNGNAVGPKCYVDCSGLVNMAVYDVYKVELNENTGSERSDAAAGKHWITLRSFDQLQPGDIIQPNEGHVEIVESRKGNFVHTFGAHSSHYPQPDQVSDHHGNGGYTKASGQHYYRYNGEAG